MELILYFRNERSDFCFAEYEDLFLDFIVMPDGTVHEEYRVSRGKNG